MIRIKNPNASNLPSEYQEIEYLQSTGTQYIDTGVAPNNNHKYIIKFSLNNVVANNSQNNQIMFGSRTTGTYATSKNQAYLNCYGLYLRFYAGTTYVELENSMANDTIYEIEEDMSTISSDYDNTSTQNIFLYALNNIGSPTAYSYMKLYKFKIYDNNVLIRDFVPCYRVSDNVVGLYDVVNKVFYTNAGTGTFLMGDVASGTARDLNISPVITKENTTPPKLPSEYQEINYIKGTGTQYIDTGAYGSNNTKIELNYDDDGGSSTVFYCGARGTLWDDRAIYMARNSATTASVNQAYSGEILEGGAKTVTIGTANHTQILDKGNWYYDGTQISTTPITTDFTTPYTLRLFGSCNNGTMSALASIKLYYCKIWENGILVRDFVPCYRVSDDVAGLYDLVNNEFYENAGSGTFTIGNEIAYQPVLEYPLLRRYVQGKLVYGEAPGEYTQLEYIQSTGTQYIDTGINADYKLSVEMDIQVTDTSSNNKHLGAINLTTLVRHHFTLQHAESKVIPRYWTGNAEHELLTVEDYKKHNYKIDAYNKKIIVDNGTPTTITRSDFDCGLNYWLFARNSTSLVYINVKIYSFKMYYSDVLVRDFVPVIRKSDNVAGMLDKVNNVFYENKGTGTFITGAVVGNI